MSRTRYTLAFDAHNMTPGIAGTANYQTIFKSEDGVLDCYGTVVPTLINTFAEGCLFHKVNASSNDVLYVNNGTYASPDFELVLEVNNGPSPLIWDNAPLMEVMLDPTLGFHYFDDFIKYGGMSVAASGTTQGLTYTERTDGLMANMPAIPGGVVQLDSVSATANQGGTIQFAGLQCEPLTGTTMYMEWRALVDDGEGQCFMGLCDDAITAPVTTGDAVTVNDHVGFFRDSGTGDNDWSVGIGDGASVEDEDDACTSTDSTYHKYGMVVTGIGAVAASTAKFYFDGVLVFTTTDIDSMPLLLMCPAFQMDAGGANVIMQIDWLRVLVHHASGACRES